MVGSAVSQGVGIATGMQDRFDWTGVAMAGLAGGVSAGLAGIGSGVAGAALRGALGNTITQGVAMATGLQKRFDWVGLAVAGVTAGVGQAVAGDSPSFWRQTAAGAVSGIAGAATRSVLTGTSFGDNILAVLPDVVGSTVGRLAAREIAGGRPSFGGAAMEEKPSFNWVTASADEIAAMTNFTDTGWISPEVQMAIAATQILAMDTDGSGFVDSREIEEARSRVRFEEDQRRHGGDPVLDSGSASSADGSRINPVPKNSISRREVQGWEAGVDNRNEEIRQNTGADATDYSETKNSFRQRYLYLDELDELAFRQVDVPIMMFVGGSAGAGTLGAAAVAGGSALPGVIAAGRQVLYANALRISTLAQLGAEAITGVPGIYVSVGAGAAVGSRVAAGSGLWKLNPFARGQQIEQALGHNLPSNFPVIDRFENGLATSIKSLDLDAAAYQSSATLNRALTGYVDKVAGF